jgi:hypothetical protein
MTTTILKCEHDDSYANLVNTIRKREHDLRIKDDEDKGQRPLEANLDLDLQKEGLKKGEEGKEKETVMLKNSTHTKIPLQLLHSNAKTQCSQMPYAQ